MYFVYGGLFAIWIYHISRVISKRSHEYKMLELELLGVD